MKSRRASSAAALLIVPVEGRQPAEVVVVGFQALCRLAPGTLDLGLLHFRCDRTDDARGDLVLQIEDLRQRSVETIGPQVGTRRGIDELAGDAQAVARPAHASLDHIADTQLAPDLLHVHGPALVGEARIPCDDEQVAEVSQGSDDVLHNAVGKIFLLRIAAQVLKRHHRNRRPVVLPGRD